MSVNVCKIGKFDEVTIDIPCSAFYDNVSVVCGRAERINFPLSHSATH